MGGGLGQGVWVRQSGRGGKGDAVGPGVVPQLQHAAHSNIHGAAGEGIVLLAVLEQADDPPVHFHRGDARLVVDGFQVVHAGIVVVDVKELVIFQQLVVEFLGLGLKGLLRLSVAQDGGDGVKQRQERGLVLLGRGLLRRGGSAAGQHQQ